MTLLFNVSVNTYFPFTLILSRASLNIEAADIDLFANSFFKSFNTIYNAALPTYLIPLSNAVLAFIKLVPAPGVVTPIIMALDIS